MLYVNLSGVFFMRSDKEGSFLSKILISVGVLALCLIAVTLAGCLVLAGIHNPVRYIGAAGCAIMVIAALIGGAVCRVFIRGTEARVCAIAASLTAAVLFLVGMIAEGGKIGIMAPINYALFIALSSLSAAMKRTGGRRRRRR